MSVILCTAGYDHTIRFWEALSGICSRTIQHPESQVNRLCITPDKKYLAAAGRHMVRLYDIKSSNPNPVMTFEGHTGNITGVAFHCEGKWMVTSSEDATVKVWDTRSGTEQRNYKHSSPVNDVVIHPNQGELITASRDGSVQVWDLGESIRTHSMTVLADVPMACVSVGSEGTILAAGNNRGDVYMWRIIQENGQTALFPCRNFKAHKDYLTRVLISPDSKLLATCSADHTVRIWRMDPNETYLEEGANDPPHPAQPPAAPASNTSSSSATDDDDDDDEDDEDSVHSSSVPSSTAGKARASAPAVEPAAAKKGGEVECILRRRPLPSDTVLDNHQRWVWDCAFSADSAYLVTVCSDHYARLWELATATIIRQYNGHHRGAVCVALNDYSEPR